MDIHRLSPEAASGVHLLTRACASPEIAVAGRTNGELLLVSAAGDVEHERLEDDVTDVAVRPTRRGRWVAIAHAHGVTVVRRDQGAPPQVDHLGGHDGRATTVAFLGGEPNAIVSADERGYVLRWTLPATSSPEPSARWRAHRKGVSRLVTTSLYSEGEVFLTASDDREIVVHAAADGTVVRRFSAHAGWVEQAVPIERDGWLSYVAAVDRVGLTVWDARNGVPVARVAGKATAGLAAASHPATGVWVAFPTPDGVTVWHDQSAGTRTLRFGRGGSTAVAIALDRSGTPTVFAATDDAVLAVDSEGEAMVMGTRLPAPVLRWLPWTEAPGALVVLRDGSIWNVTW